jgi:hypothetical protein
MTPAERARKMGKGRDKKKKKKLQQQNGPASAADGGEGARKTKKTRLDSSDDDEDLDMILESFKAKVSRSETSCQLYFNPIPYPL